LAVSIPTPSFAEPRRLDALYRRTWAFLLKREIGLVKQAKSTKSLRPDRKDGKAVIGSSFPEPVLCHAGAFGNEELKGNDGLLEHAIDGFGEFGFGPTPLELKACLASFENQDVRDSRDSVFRGKFCRFVEHIVADIKLADFDFSLVSIRQFVDGGCQGFARPTPRGRKVDYDRNTALDNFFLPVVIGEFHHMCAAGRVFSKELSDRIPGREYHKGAAQKKTPKEEQGWRGAFWIRWLVHGIPESVVSTFGVPA
jgi:hypothetical protein